VSEIVRTRGVVLYHASQRMEMVLPGERCTEVGVGDASIGFSVQ
jgi:hypothetical protein